MYGAFSRNGTFEGDYDQIASAGGYTYIVRCQGAPAYKGEPAPLIANPNGSNTLRAHRGRKGTPAQSTEQHSRAHCVADPCFARSLAGECASDRRGGDPG